MARAIVIGQTVVTIDEKTVRWTSGMTIDADGGYRTYAPPDSGLLGLDYLSNALRRTDDPIRNPPNGWAGIVTDRSDGKGAPYIQSTQRVLADGSVLCDPYPGYYVSATKLQDRTRDVSDPHRYVDSETVRFISIPSVLLAQGVQMGDVCIVHDGRQIATAIVADIGPAHRIGEGSMALAAALKIHNSPKNGGTTSGVSFCIYLNTATTPAWPRDLQSIDDQARTLSKGEFA